MSDPANTDGAPVADQLRAPVDESPRDGPRVVLQPFPPRSGELSSTWRIGTALLWIAVIVAFAAVWNSSVQLGLSTWWLGARDQPEPLAVRLIPFVPGALMVLGTINRVRRLAWFGLASSAAAVAVGLGDLGRVTSVAVLEILIGVAAAAVSAASLTGTYRPGDTTAAPTAGVS